MNAITDAPPGTAPEWAIRYSHYEGEWLVLTDFMTARSLHVCGDSFSGVVNAFAVSIADAFVPADCGCPLLTRENNGSHGRLWFGDDLAEAHAAFERIELEWLEAKRAP